MRNLLKTHWPAVIFFVGYAIVCLTVIDDYGMSWDEAVQRRHGLVALDQINESLNLGWENFAPEGYTKKFPSKYYPVLFSMTGGILERFLGIEEDFVQRYRLRHFMVNILFMLGLVTFYYLLYSKFKQSWIAIFGVVLLAFHPRIFAHSFFNPKDLVLLCFFIFGTGTLYKFLQKPNAYTALFHGIICGLAINTRMPAIFIPAVTVLLLIIRFIQTQPNQKKFTYYLFNASLMLASTIVVTFIFFPFLWQSPSQNALQAFEVMAKYPWGAHNLFFGTFVPGDQLPWYYIPAWIGITTPIPFLILFLIGVIKVIRFLFQYFLPLPERILIQDDPLPALLISMCFGPLLAVILFKSTLYNGWRHLYFIYPAMAGIMVYGYLTITELFQNRKSTSAVLAIFISLFAFVQLYRYHPHQQIYFNALAGNNRIKRFDMDYWGVGYRQALIKIAAQGYQEKVKVRCGNYPCEDNFRYLPKVYHEQLELVWQDSLADVYLSNFRRQAAYEGYMQKAPPYDRPLFLMEAGGEPFIGIFKLNEDFNRLK